jgi:hypothetical protein
MAKGLSCDETIIVFAFRYALGRRSYSVDTMVEFILTNWDRLSDKFKVRCVTEIKDAIGNGLAGERMDIANWQRIIHRHEKDNAPNRSDRKD